MAQTSPRWRNGIAVPKLPAPLLAQPAQTPWLRERHAAFGEALVHFDMQAEGIEIALVAKVVGHANPAITASHYSHAVRG